MKLPGNERARVEEQKIRGYLLNRAHPDGLAKARFFMRKGYREDDWQRLADDLRRHGRQNDVVGIVESPYGARYAVDGLLRAPSGESIRLITIWIIEKGTDVPRLVTAYPA